jgi:hypothetical protein
MLIYHGSNVIVEKPLLPTQKRGLDFGLGFYTTTNKEQAVNFTKNVVKRTKVKTRVVNVYEFDFNKANEKLEILKFEEPNFEWLEFVKLNRFSIYNGKSYDIVIGPVANDDVFPIMQAYLEGVLPAEATLAGLKVKKLYNQHCFLSIKSLEFLSFTESFTPQG